MRRRKKKEEKKKAEFYFFKLGYNNISRREQSGDMISDFQIRFYEKKIDICISTDIILGYLSE